MTAFLAAVDRLADRLRALPQSRLRQGPAAEALALARALASRAQLLESPDSEPRTLPDAGVFVVADQLAVAGHDLAHALSGAAPAGARRPAAPEPVRAQAAEARALVESVRVRCGL
ncbi:hypothetical protein ACMA1D_30700 [Streptomyces sp. 796.1]|uniref:hypothetical protein n=1 Tax=Streptomyces sp. 796.1 TaxID=3163029 RepID=UPI0039C90C1C